MESGRKPGAEEGTVINSVEVVVLADLPSSVSMKPEVRANEKEP
jgi:hypothetical protein